MQPPEPHSHQLPVKLCPASATVANGVELVSLSPIEGENHIGSASMHTTATSNLVLTDLFSFKRLAEHDKRVSHAGLYQGIARTLIRGFHTERALTDLATKLTSIGDHAYSIRQPETVGDVGQLLLSLPLSRQMESAGAYYQALSLNRFGDGDTVRAGNLFEQVADNGSFRYRARAMLALGTNSLGMGDGRTAMSFYREVMRILARERVFDPVILSMTRKMITVIRGMSGDHHGAVADLESMFPLARVAGALLPYTYYDYLNSLAVELGEVGRLAEARRASEIALSNPFATRYPWMRETLEDITLKQRRASRSMVAVPQSIGETQRVRPYTGETEKLVHLPSRGPVADVDSGDQRRKITKARVLDFQQWKTALLESRPSVLNNLTPEQRNRMTTGEKLIRLMDLLSRDETDDGMIDRILEVVEEIVLKSCNQN